MRLWIDAQLSPALAPWLHREFHVEATALRDIGLRDAMDALIFDRARAEGAVLLTKDGDFVHMVERSGPPPQVLWLTCGNTSNAELFRILGATFAAARGLLERGEPIVEIHDALNARPGSSS